MRKVYLIYASEGQYDDYQEWIVDARFDRDEAFDELERLENEFEALKKRKWELKQLGHRYSGCGIEGCKLCKEYRENYWWCSEGNGYWINEIQVCELGEDMFECNEGIKR